MEIYVGNQEISEFIIFVSEVVRNIVIRYIVIRKSSLRSDILVKGREREI